MRYNVIPLALLLLLAIVGTAMAKPDTVTICHAAGREGTTKFVTLTLPYNAVYGNGGHFNENGTTRAGHEQDYLGPCVGNPTPTPTATATGNPTVTPSNRPSETPVTPSATPTSEPTPTVTPSEIPSASPSVEPTPEPSETPQITLPPTDTE